MMHLRKVEDKKFILSAIKYCLRDIQIFAGQNICCQILLNILLSKVLKNKWMDRSNLLQVNRVKDTLVAISKFSLAVFTQEVLKAWPYVCFYLTHAKVKELSGIIKQKVADPSTFTLYLQQTMLPIVLQFLADDHPHDIASCTLIKIFCKSKEDLLAALDKVESNKATYTQEASMKLTKFTQKTTGIGLLSCDASLRCLMMSLEACMTEIKIYD